MLSVLLRLKHVETFQQESNRSLDVLGFTLDEADSVLRTRIVVTSLTELYSGSRLSLQFGDGLSCPSNDGSGDIVGHQQLYGGRERRRVIPIFRVVLTTMR